MAEDRERATLHHGLPTGKPACAARAAGRRQRKELIHELQETPSRIRRFSANHTKGGADPSGHMPGAKVLGRLR